MGLILSDHEIAALEQRTEGWVAGLQLATLAMRERTAIAISFNHLRAAIAWYLIT